MWYARLFHSIYNIPWCIYLLLSVFTLCVFILYIKNTFWLQVETLPQEYATGTEVLWPLSDFVWGSSRGALHPSGSYKASFVSMSYELQHFEW